MESNQEEEEVVTETQKSTSESFDKAEETPKLPSADAKQTQDSIVIKETDHSLPAKHPSETPTTKFSDTITQLASQTDATPNQDIKAGKKKEDDKLAIYKGVAIKLKKDLYKSREDLQKLREDSQVEISAMKERIELLDKTLESERQANTATIATLEATVKSLKQQVQNYEIELETLQRDFEEYKVRASAIMQQNNSMHSNVNRTFEEERYKQLKELSDEQGRRISSLELQLSKSLDRNQELEDEKKLALERLDIVHEKAKITRNLENKCETLSRENENLKLALKQFRTKLKEPSSSSNKLQINCDDSNKDISDTGNDQFRSAGDVNENNTTKSPNDSNNLFAQVDALDSKPKSDQADERAAIPIDDRLDENTTRLSPSTSVKDGSNTNSSSSFDGSTSGYVHIKPTTFEIISRSSVLEDAQNQIDNLTKAYLDSENTNSLLTEQVKALKDEIRRMQRGTERMDLAENLEYLKNVVFKYISLDSGQVEQRQRLVPVLSTVLKLSPDETAKLSSLATADKSSMASSFFKL